MRDFYTERMDDIATGIDHHGYTTESLVFQAIRCRWDVARTRAQWVALVNAYHGFEVIKPGGKHERDTFRRMVRNRWLNSYPAPAERTRYYEINFSMNHKP